MIDIPQKKNNIIEFLKKLGPSLPVRIARAIEMDTVFASAILSELLSSKQIITSHMKVGASPLYLLPDQKEQLETKTDNLKSIEKGTQEELKREKVIFDEEKDPATRVALRNIKDFAIPFRFKGKITWKYAFSPQEEIDEILFSKPSEKDDSNIAIEETEKSTTDNRQPTTESEVPKAWEIKKEEIEQAKKNSKKIESTLEKPKQHDNQTFLNQIKIFLEKQDIKIIAIEEVDKKKIIAITESNSKQAMLFAFNKKRITEIELFKCYKHAKKANLSYHIITKDNPTKKMEEIIDAYKKLIKIEKL